METWRLLDTVVRPASENMALDEALLELRAQERIPSTLQFLQFSAPLFWRVIINLSKKRISLFF
jgi:lipoate-protein ligase A